MYVRIYSKIDLIFFKAGRFGCEKRNFLHIYTSHFDFIYLKTYATIVTDGPDIN